MPHGIIAPAMPSRPRKSSACVTLVLIGAATVAGCGPNADDGAARRKQYATKEACVADWGDPDECAQQSVQEADGARRHYYSYSGSGYRWGFGRSGSGGTMNRSIARGGFGASGHTHASGS
jgi:hypothetical protein